MIDLDRIRIWLAANKLTLNTAKREFLLIGSRQILSTLERNPIIDINQLFPIKQVSTSKSLGGHIDGSLSYSGSVLWKGLPLEVRQLTSPRRKFRLTNSFYLRF